MFGPNFGVVATGALAFSGGGVAGVAAIGGVDVCGVIAGGTAAGWEAFAAGPCVRAALPGRVCGRDAVPGSAFGMAAVPGSAGGVVPLPGSGCGCAAAPGSAGGMAPLPGSGCGCAAAESGAGGREGVRVTEFGRGREEPCGTYAEPGSAGVSVPGWVKEPIGGGPLETGGATGAATRDPGSGGAVVTGCGRAIWPTSGTALGAGTGAGVETGAAGREAAGRSACTGAPAATGLLASPDPLWFTINFATRLICTTASTHSVPQATAEERSRSDDRMVEGGGVTGC